ncbi:MAG: hypothetical protein Q9180_007686, partial [Flavoplaca navasiana]
MPRSKKKTSASAEKAAPLTPTGSKLRATLNPLEEASPALAGPPLPKRRASYLDGIRVIAGKDTEGPDLVGSDVSLCGYLGLADTKQLRELHAQLLPLLDRLEAIIKEGYYKEVIGKTTSKTQIEVSKLFGYISQQNGTDISDFDLKSTQWPLPVEGSTFHAVYRPFSYSRVGLTASTGNR